MNMRVGPWSVNVALTAHDDLDGDYGDWTLATKTIRVRNDLSELETAMTVIHELFHALSDLHHLRLSEQSVRALENSITQIIQDHPLAVMALVESVAPYDPDTRDTSASRTPWGQHGSAKEPDTDPPRAVDGRGEPYGPGGDGGARCAPRPARSDSWAQEALRKLRERGGLDGGEAAEES